MRVACLRAPERNMGGYFAERTKSLKFLLKEACEAQTYFRSSFGGREAATVNTSALRRLS